MRLPDAVASLPLARATLNLFASVWERRYEHIYSRGEALFNLAQQGDFSHIEVSGVLTTLVTTFIGMCSVPKPTGTYLLCNNQNSPANGLLRCCQKHIRTFPWRLLRPTSVCQSTNFSLVCSIQVGSLFTTYITFSATQVASENGWHFDPTTHILTPTRAARKTSLAAGAQASPVFLRSTANHDCE